MRQVCWALVAVLLVMGPGAASAQTIDAGRGELPVHVPSGYDAAAPAPLIVLLHGYTSSGTINGGGHVPALSAHFTRLVVEWLLGHPKP